MTDTNTTLYNLVRSAYPGQYYGQIDTSSTELPKRPAEGKVAAS